MGDRATRRAREIVHRILYVTIASVSVDGRPWNSPVYSSFDDDGNFYWISSPLAQHSRNVESNGEAFLVIYDSTVPEGTGEGVYVEATADVLTRPEEIARARAHLALRIGKPIDDDLGRFSEDDVLRAYRAVPRRVWMNDDEKDEHGNFVRDVRVEIPVGALRDLVTWVRAIFGGEMPQLGRLSAAR